jgi:hypothetical protein
MSHPTPDIESDLVDLTEVSLADLPAYDDHLLFPTMRRLLQRIDDPESVTSGYNPQRID